MIFNSTDIQSEYIGGQADQVCAAHVRCQQRQDRVGEGKHFWEAQLADLVEGGHKDGSLALGPAEIAVAHIADAGIGQCLSAV